MSSNMKCPKCGMELPAMLLAAHVEDCDEGPDDGDTPDLTPPVGSIRDFIQDNKDVLDDDEDFLDLDKLGTMDEREGSGGVAEASMDDEFARLVGSLDLSDIGPMIPGVVVTTLNDAELSSHYNETREQLLERGEMIEAKTQTGRDLHSQRAAYIIELRRRGLLT